VVVKFVEGAYGIDVHKYLADQGCAPRIEHFDRALTSRYQVVVMQYIDGAQTLHDYINDGNNPDDIVKQCKATIEDMHKKEGYCHGDLRPNNILVSSNNGQFKFYVIGLEKLTQKGIQVS